MSLDSLNNSTETLIPRLVGFQDTDLGLGVDIVIILMAMAAVIFGFFYLFKKYIMPILDSGKGLKKLELLLFRIEVCVWLVFTLFALTQLLTENLWVTVGLLAVVGLVGLNFWRDFFPGLLLRVSNKFQIKDPVRFKDFSGILEKLGVTTVHLKTDDEELVYIPYRQLNNGIFIKRQAKGKLISSKIILNIGHKNPDQVIDQVSTWIHECPWAIGQGANNASIQPGGLLNVTVYATDSSSLGKVERFIKNKLEKM